MQLISKSATVTLLLFLVFLNPLYASDLKWKNLPSLEKFLLSEHQSTWGSYRDSKKNVLYISAKNKAKKLKKYRKWVKKNLSVKQQKTLKINFKKMNNNQFRKYMDRLFKKYGRPS